MKKAKRKSSNKSAPAVARKVTDKEVCVAAEHGSVAELRSLLNAGGNPNASLRVGKLGTRASALYLANGTKQEQLAKVKALLAAGADVNYHRAATLSAIDRFPRRGDVEKLLAPLANSETIRNKIQGIIWIGGQESEVQNLVWLAQMFLGPKKFAKLEAEIQDIAEAYAAKNAGALKRYKELLVE